MAVLLTRRRAILLAALVLALCANAAIQNITAYRSDDSAFPWDSEPANAGLAVAPDRLDFGEVWEDSRFAWTLPLENRRNEDLSIEDISASCTCVSVEPRAFVIPARQTRQVKLALDLTASRSKLADSEWREFEVMIRPIKALQALGEEMGNRIGPQLSIMKGVAAAEG